MVYNAVNAWGKLYARGGLLITDNGGSFESSVKAELKNGLEVTGDATITGGNITVSGETNLATSGGTTNCGGNLSVKGQATVLGGLVITKGFQLGSGDFYIYGNKYTDQDITSTDGTVYAVIGRKKS